MAGNICGMAFSQTLRLLTKDIDKTMGQGMGHPMVGRACVNWSDLDIVVRGLEIQKAKGELCLCGNQKLNN
ncbi:MAG: hypothetical protein JRJ79_10470 [Deltaproteobacteria bacterium]|nr:hypothetical protein [Deltaproteobacteria bacterium]MBW2341862.1 hypothetical protein [Deltaproteobacteria bacterium]